MRIVYSRSRSDSQMNNSCGSLTMKQGEKLTKKGSAPQLSSYSRSSAKCDGDEIEQLQDLSSTQFMNEIANQAEPEMRGLNPILNSIANSWMNTKDRIFCAQKHQFDINLFVTKQTISEGLLELALLTINAVQMRSIAETGKFVHPFYITCMFCVCTSLIIQLIIGVLLIVNGRYNINRWAEEQKAELFANISFVLIFIVTIINIFLSTFKT